jgi:predicted nucleotidyltransferase
MKAIANQLKHSFQTLLPDPFEILKAANLTVHDAVYCVALEGSRGLKGGNRPDSDIDVSLLVDSKVLEPSADKGALLNEVIDVTLGNWRSKYELAGC